MINITPASAFEIGQMANELNKINDSSDIKTIQKWNNKGGWYRFWHLVGFCKAAHRLASKADHIKDKVSDMNSSLNATYENLTTIKGYLNEQEKLDKELDNFLAGNGTDGSPQTAIADANYIQSELKSTNKTIDVGVNVNVNKPQNGDLVQLISDVSENKDNCRYNLDYWYYKEITEDSDTGESMVKLYNGEEYVTMSLATFNKRFTGVVLNVKDITTSNTNNTKTNQTNSNPLVKSVDTKTAKNNSAADISQKNSQKKVSAQLCSIVITIQTIQKNHLKAMKDLIPDYDSDLAHLLSLLAMVFAIVGTILWCVGGILTLFLPLIPLGIILCVTGGLFLVASSALSFYGSSMANSSDETTMLDHMLGNVDSRTVP